jgi:kumamolisin
MNRQHVELPGSSRPEKDNARRVGDVDPDSPIEITVSLRGPSLPAPDAVPAKPLSRSEYAAQYSASKADADTVTNILKQYGLQVVDVSLPARSMRVKGPASAMEAAFQPKLGIYQSTERGKFRGREGGLKIPAELEGIVTGVFGLDERQAARRKAG